MISIQVTLSCNLIIGDQDYNKLGDVGPLSPSSCSTRDFATLEKPENSLECIPKDLFNIIHRNRRASISRPYFHHWRKSRDNIHHTSRQSLASSPRLDKRAYENYGMPSSFISKRQTEKDNGFNGLDAFLDYLQKQNIDVVCEDTKRICFSKVLSSDLLRQALDQSASIQRRQAKEVDKLHFKTTHPLLFRYRLG